MPYIDKEARDSLDGYIRGASSPGELNYQLTRILQQGGSLPELWNEVTGYYDRVGKQRIRNYELLNDIVGALMCSSLEYLRRAERYDHEALEGIQEAISLFYRTYAVPYEDQKKEENGDVYSIPNCASEGL